jgi:hypothetical protein
MSQASPSLRENPRTPRTPRSTASPGGSFHSANDRSGLFGASDARSRVKELQSQVQDLHQSMSSDPNLSSPSYVTTGDSTAQNLMDKMMFNERSSARNVDAEELASNRSVHTDFDPKAKMNVLFIFPA